MLKNISFIISAPSGTGKSSLIQSFLKTNLGHNFRLITSYTTRNIRSEEIHGKDYFFISKSNFKKMIIEKNFLEYTYIFGNYYGTPLKNVNNQINNGFHILFDTDFYGMQKIKQYIPTSISVFILPPSLQELENRLKNRNNKKEIKKYTNLKIRINQAKIDVQFCNKYDFILVNENFNQTLNDFKCIISIKKFQLLKYKQYIKNIINQILKN
ncbi:guanylate kinase [Wigglesworthia glossinidia endosymbiont of Glossina morsitans morsitans (Yale colony)]|uniref:Guanylate kinase n=1 Tax=Wigglesworthia glossinidia endosymbiont of Glossina morsitans morsitans (Yale colony) TaxID=1142511 RepID=H6Q5Z6_WIGGL|nr:guanylate kinase [Wigglesworthia glossinidia]AFA41192.1 guanylate kinase [Wigglesworthia glossinidia endosymbiont of Glossina morsitans morsitans (Yale colony)]